MKISAKDLQIMVRNILLEQDDTEAGASPEEASQPEPEQNVEDQIANNIANFQNILFDINDSVHVNVDAMEDGGLRLTINSEELGTEMYPDPTYHDRSLSVEDISTKSELYIDFLLKLSQLLAGKNREDVVGARRIYKELEQVLLNFDAMVMHPQTLITFDKLYVLRGPSS